MIVVILGILGIVLGIFVTIGGLSINRRAKTSNYVPSQKALGFFNVPAGLALIALGVAAIAVGMQN